MSAIVERPTTEYFSPQQDNWLAVVVILLGLFAFSVQDWHFSFGRLLGA